MIAFIAGVLAGALLVLGALWKSGMLEHALSRTMVESSQGLEFLKLPEGIKPEKRK